MATFQPSEEDIQMFIACAPDMNRQEVIARIKSNSNNVEFAINEYFEDPGSRKYDHQWVDAMFSNDENPPNNTTFNIHSPDETRPSPYEIREPQTRPPTPSRRANNRSPKSNVIDLSMEHANADPRSSVAHDNDAELRRAIEESRVTAGLAPQESGITGMEEVSFGPATRSQYEENEWAMIPIGKNSAQEILLDPEPSARKRDLNVPAFLKPSADGSNRIGAIFTIYHEIPLLREVLLNRLDVQQNYGYDPEWWSGKPIEFFGILGFEPDGNQELIYEIQRLMAFLDKTDRSYGSAEVIARLSSVAKARRLNARNGKTDDLTAGVILAWKSTFDGRENGQVSKLFSKGVDSELGTESDEFAILDLSHPAKNSGMESFYDIADQLLWPQPQDDIANCAYLDHIADVITFRLNDDNAPSNDVDIPAIWYPDRYLKSGRQAAWDMRQQKVEVNEELQKITSLQDTLTQVYYKGKMLKVKAMFEAALQHNYVEIDDEDHTFPGQNSLSQVEAMAQIPDEKAKKLSADLSRLVDSIDKKLLELDSQKEKAKETLRQLSKLYTDESSESSERPTHRYTLRGVSTTNSTMYIRRRAEIDLIDMGLDNDGLAANGDQWWRIEYCSSDSNPVSVEKTTEEKVLKAAKADSKDSILVYASEKAMQFESKQLPLQLENFVRQDNQLFLRELAAADDSRSQASYVTSPGKRKYQSHSDFGEESNRWNGGTSPKGYENSVQIMERELRLSDGSSESDGVQITAQHFVDQIDESRTVTPGDIEPEVLHGMDPALLGNDGTQFSGQEMQERSHLPMTSSMQVAGTSKINSMDFDHVMEDDYTTEESAAVKHIDLA